MNSGTALERGAAAPEPDAPGLLEREALTTDARAAEDAAVEAPAAIPMAPVQGSERIEFIDVLRGAALFGILAANMRGHNAPAAIYGNNALLFPDFANRLTQALLDLFVSGKFITLFACLFGLGFAVQMSRAEARGVSASSFYPRRLLVLAGFGLLHGALVWWGDILLIYSVMGAILLAFHRRSTETIVKWMAGVWLGMLILLSVSVVMVNLSTPDGPSSNPRRAAGELRRVVETYQSGWPPAIVAENFSAWGHYVLKDLSVLTFLPIFLFGLWVWRRGLLQDLPAQRALLARVCRVALPLGLLLAAFNEHARLWLVARSPRDPLWLPATIADFYGTPILSLGYASGLGLLLLRPGWAARLKPFGAVGRMALTNYLMQSVTCLVLFVGTGLYGRVGPLWGLVPTVLLYAAQVAFSNWWLARYRFGPMEYVWRSLTYGTLGPLRRT